MTGIGSHPLDPLIQNHPSWEMTMNRAFRLACWSAPALWIVAAMLYLGDCSRTRAEAPDKSPQPKVEELVRIIDSLDVEHHWLAGRTVYWRTGKMLRKTVKPGPHTHCSAFVAVACRKLGVPILSPPSQINLANRQQDWLVNRGWSLGWSEVDGDEAQRLANRGWVVLASFKNTDPKFHRGHGHIAILRPAEDPAKLGPEGIRIAQAGGQNYNSTTLEVGFHAKIERVRFFAHSRKVETQNVSLKSDGRF